MKDLLTQFVKLAETYEEYRRRLDAYERILKTKEWEFVRDTLLMIRAEMMRDLLSFSHTRLEEREKDVRQRVYYQLNEILDLLLEPRKWIRKRSRWDSVVTEIERKAQKARQKGLKHAGRENT